MSLFSITLGIGFLLILVSSAIALIHAFKTAEDGYEDESGYHSLTPQKAAEPDVPTALADDGWDNLEGACFAGDWNQTVDETIP